MKVDAVDWKGNNLSRPFLYIVYNFVNNYLLEVHIKRIDHVRVSKTGHTIQYLCDSSSVKSRYKEKWMIQISNGNFAAISMNRHEISCVPPTAMVFAFSLLCCGWITNNTVRVCNFLKIELIHHNGRFFFIIVVSGGQHHEQAVTKGEEENTKKSLTFLLYSI